MWEEIKDLSVYCELPPKPVPFLNKPLNYLMVTYYNFLWENWLLMKKKKEKTAEN